MMKNKAFCLLLIIPFLTLSCKRKVTEFKVNDTTEFIVPSSIILLTPLTIIGKESTVDFEEEFKNNDTRAKYLKEVKLEELLLTITAPQGKTFSFLRSVSIYISADGLDEILLASKENIDNSVGNQLYLQPTAENLVEYVKKNDYKVRCQVITDETTYQDITIRGDFKFYILSKAALF